MTSFKEFLEDYEKKEKARAEKYLQRLEEGKISSDEIYPPKDRFKNLKEPIAKSPMAGFSVWSVVPFYGSTLIPLIPRGNLSRIKRVLNDALVFPGFDQWLRRIDLHLRC